MSVYNLSGGLTVVSDSITYQNLTFVLEGGVTAPIDYLHLSTSIFSLEGNAFAPIDYLTLESTPITPTPTPSWTEQILNVFRMIYPILLLLLIVFFIALLIKTLRDFLKKRERRKRISETHAVA
ncbi:MAG: hypothetical protein NDF51_05370 [archaeon YNP-WB-040]|nr:hypothetical protein [Candidatus Culexarchaeum yellowstonense]